MDPTPPIASITRRDALRILGVFGTSAALPACVSAPAHAALPLVQRNDEAVAALLRAQVTDPASPFRGSVGDRFGLHTAGAVADVIETLAASFVHPESAFHRDPELVRRIELAAGFLGRAQSPRGNIDLLVTNFDSPPDTAFVVHGVATAAAIGRRHGHEELPRILGPFLQRAGAGMAAGGVHTPNHRWVVCSALAQVHELFPDPRYVARIDEWLAEGIDIDADGQFSERSTLVYNPITDRALVVMAAKLDRPELLEPVRRNLRGLRWLLHADGELVTEISRRHDRNARGGVGRYWFPLRYLALHDRDPELATLARDAACDGERLSTLLEYPELSAPLPPSVALPDQFAVDLPAIGIARIRRGRTSATLLLGGSSLLLTLRHGDAVLDGVRMAAAFFGKGQFVPDAVERRDSAYRLSQSLVAPYYQPLPERVAPDAWEASRARRRHSEVCRLEQSAEIRETGHGLELTLRSHGTDGVPVAVELGFRAGGHLTGCLAVPDEPDRFVLPSGSGSYRVGQDAIRFGPGAAAHRYTQVRGAEPKLGGPSVYVTGFTPFEHTLVLGRG
jgi:hypothetical protein